MRDKWTTLAGVATILGGCTTFIGMCLATKGVPPGEAWAVLGGAFTIGAGFIKAADGKPKDPPQ